MVRVTKGMLVIISEKEKKYFTMPLATICIDMDEKEFFITSSSTQGIHFKTTLESEPEIFNAIKRIFFSKG